jgi:hypothetical protein
MTSEDEDPWLLGVAEKVRADNAKAERSRRATAERERLAELESRETRMARDWFLNDPRAVVIAKRNIVRHLRSPEGRNGPSVLDLSQIVGVSGTEMSLKSVRLCVDDLKKHRAIKETEAGEIYDIREWGRLQPERRWAVKDIGTLPRAVLDHKELTEGRLRIAIAFNDHFFRTRRAWPKARAIGYRELARNAGVANSTAQIALQWLFKERLLEPIRKAAGSRGREYRWTAETKAYKSPKKPRRFKGMK